MILYKAFSFAKLNYIQQGVNSSNNLLILHGILGQSSNFNSISRNRELLQKTNFFLLDNRNHGKSPHMTSNTIEQMAGDIKWFIEQKKLNNLYLLGHSLGAKVVMQISQSYPQLQQKIKMIIIEDMTNRENSCEMESIKTLLYNLNSIKLGKKQDIIKQLKKFVNNEELLKFIMKNLQYHDQHDNMKWKPNIKVLYQSFDHIRQHRLTKPTKWTNDVKFIFGQKSEFWQGQKTINQFQKVYLNAKKSDFFVIQNADHWVHYSNKEKFIKVLLDLIK